MARYAHVSPSEFYNMGDLEQEAWADAVKDLIDREEANNDNRLKDLMKPKEFEGASYSGLGNRSPHELLPKIQL